MTRLMPSDVEKEVHQVLMSVAGDSTSRPYLTAYQILSRLPSATCQRLIAERGRGGAKSGVYYGAPSVVATAAGMLSNIDIRFIDTGDLSIHIDGENVTAGCDVVGIYRLFG